jgi:hypothetical protein
MTNAKHSACLLQLTCACLPRTFCAMDVKFSSQCSRPLSLNPNLRSLCRGPYLQARNVKTQNTSFTTTVATARHGYGDAHSCPHARRGAKCLATCGGCSVGYQIQHLLLLMIRSHKFHHQNRHGHSTAAVASLLSSTSMSMKWCHLHCRHYFGVSELHISGPSSSAYYFGIDNCITQRHQEAERH